MMVRVDNVTYRYGKRIALNGCSLDIAAGGITGLLGPNGSGKTTLLELISRQRRWQDGRARVDGSGSYESLTVGWASSEAILYEGVGVRAFVERTYGPARGLSPRESAERGNALAEALRFTADYSRKPRELSRGNRTKASLLLAMLHQPDVLLLDEPFTGLDVGTLDAFLELIASYKTRTCILIADHQVGVLESIVDRVYFIGDGTMRGSDDARALVTRHGSLTDAYRSVFS
jgi:ABC-2 type transport system ATP-binding protein